MSDASQPVGCGLFSYGDDLLKKCGQNHCPRKVHFWTTYVAQKTSLLKLPIDSIFPCFHLIYSLKKHYTPVNPRSKSRFVFSALSLMHLMLPDGKTRSLKLRDDYVMLKYKEQTMTFNCYCRHKWCKKRSPSCTRRFAR